MERMPMEHELKILPEYFVPVSTKQKSFEIRKNDRDFRVGDSLLLREWKNGAYTGRECKRYIVYIFYGTGEFGIAEGYCVLGLSDNRNDSYNPT